MATTKGIEHIEFDYIYLKQYIEEKYNNNKI